MNASEVIQLLNSHVESAGSQKALAERVGVSPQYLNDVLHNRREPGAKLLEPLHIKRIVSYEVTK